MPPAREARLRGVIAHRQLDLLVVLENVTDPHNLMAVMRTADAVGVQTVLALQSYPPYGRHGGPVQPDELPDPESEEWALRPIEPPKRRARKGLGVANLGARSSSGTVKWMDLQVFEERDKLILALRERLGPEGRLLGLTAQDDGHPPCQDLYHTDLRGPVALALGNERDGLSPALLAACDGRISIPQVGMAQSLNISVAAAVSLYEALRQRRLNGDYRALTPPNAAQEALFQRWHAREAAKKR
jgi:tRNA (guanosine-2'-O-)-methyltransferase